METTTEYAHTDDPDILVKLTLPRSRAKLLAATIDEEITWSDTDVEDELSDLNMALTADPT